MDRISLFPDTAHSENGNLTIAGCDLTDLARHYGTPLYIYDRATLDHAASAYKSLLDIHYPATASITYAGKAYLGVAIAQWAVAQGLTVDCTGLSEIAIAVQAGVPRGQIIVHGVNKSSGDLLAALEHAGTIVVDNLSELNRLVKIAKSRTWHFGLPDLWLRLQPGMAVDTHAYTQTGHSDSKFGMSFEQCLLAYEICQTHHLSLKGIHLHQGSQFRDPSPLGPGIERALDLAAKFKLGDDWHLSPGGGWGVAYHEDDLPHPSLEEYVCYVCESVVSGCLQRNLTLPSLHLEPGRSIVARAGVALYRVGTVKRTEQRTWLLIDGGMADNPRYALYGVKYSALPVQGTGRMNQEEVHIAGPYCESGDVLIEGLPFPKIEEGELIAIPMSGAYQLSMASNYNGALRPAVLMLDGGVASVIQERQLPQDLFKHDIPL
jgi:diaminopimelate decarboxylase